MRGGASTKGQGRLPSMVSGSATADWSGRDLASKSGSPSASVSNLTIVTKTCDAQFAMDRADGRFLSSSVGDLSTLVKSNVAPDVRCLVASLKEGNARSDDFCDMGYGELSNERNSPPVVSHGGSLTAVDDGVPLSICDAPFSSTGGGSPLLSGDRHHLSVVGDVLPPVSASVLSPLGGGRSPPVVGGRSLLVEDGRPESMPGDDDDDRVKEVTEKAIKNNAAGGALTSTLRRSQRRASQRGKINEDPVKAEGKEKSSQRETQGAKSKKSLFPMFFSLKRNIAQAISPEGKMDSEPISKKAN